MKYSISTLKIALGISITENTKLTKEQKIKVLEFVQKGTDVQIQHLALTGEVKHTFTESEKKQINEKCGNVKIKKELKENIIREFDEDDLISTGKIAGGAIVAGLVGSKLGMMTRKKDLP